ncbi:hypothetical protein [Uliginosibacterium gangwonense]|uniref:hypothetical protein n=1 Tax=Uliginosibacterium gangwonense TaxID=392736 RepID=UPI00037169B5|nr:hypothetical protein [Uliginosibacterium gangwonense]
MQDLDDRVQKLRAIFQDSVTAVQMADEASANEALEAYQSLRHASDRLFDLLIVLENTGQTVSTVRALANHFFLANVLDRVSEPIAEVLNNIAACLPGIAKPDGTRIQSGPVQPGASPPPQVTAFVRTFDHESEWREAMLIGRAFTVLKRHPFSNARTKAVADAATRIKQLGYPFSIRSGRYQIRSESIENIVGEIWRCLHRLGCINALSNIMRVALESQVYAYEQILFGRKYAGGYGDRLPGVPIGLLYNIAVKLPALGSNERNARSFWDKAICMARDLVAMLDLEPYSQFAFLGLDAQALEDGLRRVAHYDHCFALRQWHLSFTLQFLAVFFGESFDADMKQRLGWNVADAIQLAQVLKAHARPGTQVVPNSRLLETGFGPGVFKSMLPFFAHREGEANKNYRSPFGAAGPDVIFKPLILLKGNSVVLPAASVLGPAMFEATFAAWRTNRTDKEIDSLKGDGTERLTKYLFAKHGLQPCFENAKYDLGEQGAGECDLVFEDEENIILVECKAKALTRGAMTGIQGDALLDFAGGLFASQAQALRHERILRSEEAIHFRDGTRLELRDRHITRLTVTLLDHGALQDRWMLRSVYNALLSAEVTCDPCYTKKKQVKEFNEKLRMFQEETRLLEAAGQDINAHPLNAASASVAQLDVILESVQSLSEVRTRLSTRMTFSTFNVLLEYFHQQKMRGQGQPS